MNMKKLLPYAAALLAGLAGYALLQALREQPPAADVALTRLEFTDLDGNRKPLTAWQGKLILLNFWATWCPPCREEIPLFISLQERYGAQGLQIIGVAIDRGEAVTRFRDEMGVNYPLLLGGEEALSTMRLYGNALGVLPYSVVIDPQGRTVASKTGAYRPAELENQILPHLKRPPLARF